MDQGEGRLVRGQSPGEDAARPTHDHGAASGRAQPIQDHGVASGQVQPIQDHGAASGGHMDRKGRVEELDVLSELVSRVSFFKREAIKTPQSFKPGGVV